MCSKEVCDSCVDDNSNVFHYPKQKEIRKLIDIDKREEVKTWQHDIVEDFNKNQAYLQECLECSVCYEIIIKPLVCPFCANVFCQECLRRWSRIHSNCPTCRAN